MLITDQHKKYLSSILTGTDEESILDAVAQASYTWGLNPDSPEPTDAEWSESEQEALSVLTAIREGLEDGTISASAPKNSDYAITDSDAEDAKLLDALGV